MSSTELVGAIATRAFVGVTDIDWYRQLSADRQRVDEVNFWFPSSGQGFGALNPGEVFLFKTHVDRRRPDIGNKIVGLGTYSGFARVRISEAWDWFGRANGVTGPAELRVRVARYRKLPIGRFEDPEIGCVLLRDVLFFGISDSLHAPDDFSTNIVRGKTYDLARLSPQHPVAQALSRYEDRPVAPYDLGPVDFASADTRGDPRLIVPRVGQQAFKALISDAYHHRCALTGEKVRPVLEAAHIVPVASGGEHRLDNGLLLRSDMHTLFDRGYIAFDPKFRLRVSPALRDQFGNGDWLYAREGSEIAVPDSRRQRPNAEFLEWHNAEVFQAAD